MGTEHLDGEFPENFPHLQFSSDLCRQGGDGSPDDRSPCKEWFPSYSMQKEQERRCVWPLSSCPILEEDEPPSLCSEHFWLISRWREITWDTFTALLGKLLFPSRSRPLTHCLVSRLSKEIHLSKEKHSAVLLRCWCYLHGQTPCRKARAVIHMLHPKK